MKIYYWSPHLSKVGTIKSVYNSCKSLRNKGIDAKIINAIGEWSHIDDEIRIDLLKKIFTINYPARVISKVDL